MRRNEFLKQLHNPWLPIALKAAKAEEGKPHDPITREEIAFALENSSETPPPVVRKLLAQIVKGEYQFKRGIKGRRQAEKQAAVSWFLSFRKAFESHPKMDALRDHYSQRGELSLRGAALQVASVLYHVTPRTLENWIKEHESLVLEAHKNAGRAFCSLGQAIDYEDEMETAASYRVNLQGWPTPPLK